jgi:hypothetical protein
MFLDHRRMSQTGTRPSSPPCMSNMLNSSCRPEIPRRSLQKGIRLNSHFAGSKKTKFTWPDWEETAIWVRSLNAPPCETLYTRDDNYSGVQSQKAKKPTPSDETRHLGPRSTPTAPKINILHQSSHNCCQSTQDTSTDARHIVRSSILCYRRRGRGCRRGCRRGCSRSRRCCSRDCTGASCRCC